MSTPKMSTAKLNKEQTKQAKKLFQRLDTDKDNELSLDDLIQGFGELGVPDAEHAAVQFMRGAAAEGSTEVDFWGFFNQLRKSEESFLRQLGMTGIIQQSAESPIGARAIDSLRLGSKMSMFNPKEATRHQISDSKILRRFDLKDRIGKGGFGVTYVGIDRDLMNKKVLCKFLHNMDEGALVLFRREAEKLLELSHPNIPAVSAYFEIPEKSEYLIVMEFIDGKNLEEIVEASGSMKEDQVMSILRDVFGVLEYIHGKGIVHRDIKPANIMKAKSDGKIYLVDFGACAQTKGGYASTIIGTRGYFPPEIMQGCGSYESDFFSLGACALFLLTGEEPARMLTAGSDNPFLPTLLMMKKTTKITDEMFGLLTAMLEPNPSRRRAAIEKHPSSVLSTSSAGSLSGKMTYDAMKAIIRAETARDDFLDRVLAAKSSDAQDTAAMAFITAGDCDPDVKACNVRDCTLIFNFLQFDGKVTLAIILALAQKMIRDLNQKLEAVVGTALPIEADAVVRESAKQFILGAHRYAHMHAATDVDILHQMRFALMYMACRSCMAEVSNQAASLVANVLARSLDGPSMLQFARQQDDFSDALKSAKYSDAQRAKADQLVAQGDCRPNVKDCGVKDCTAKFNFVHVSGDVCLVMIEAVVDNMIKALEDALFQTFEQRDMFTISKRAVMADAYKLFVQAVHRYTHGDAPFDPPVLHSMRTALIVAASDASMKEVRDGAVQRLEAMLTKKSADSPTGKSEARRKQATRQVRRVKSKEKCIIS